jgi:hypothetical protein
MQRHKGLHTCLDTYLDSGGSLQAVARPIRRLHDRSEVGRAFGVQAFGVPFHFRPLAHIGGPHGQVAKQDGFGQRPGVIREVGHGAVLRIERIAAADGVKELFPVTGRLRERDIADIHAAHDMPARAAVTGRVQFALRADDERTAVGDFAVVDEIGKTRLLEVVARGAIAAVVPCQRHGLADFVGRELEDDFRRFRIAVLVMHGGFGLYADGVAQIEGHERQVDIVAGHVAERARAEVPPSAPVEVVVGRFVLHFALVVDQQGIRADTRRAEPQVPVQVGRRRGGRRTADALRPDRAIGPDMHLGDVAKRARPDRIRVFAHAVVGGSLIAHLRGDFHLTGQLGKVAHLVNGVREGLLAVNGLVHMHRHRRRRRVGMIGDADGHSIYLPVHFVQHFAIVGVLFGFGVLRRRAAQRVGVHIADGDHVAIRIGIGGVAVALASHTDTGDIDSVIGRLVLLAPGASADPDGEAAHKGAFQQVTAIGLKTHGSIPFRCQAS